MHRLEEGREGHAVEARLKLRECLGVIDCLGIAALRDRERGLGEPGLKGEDILRVGLGTIGRLAGQGERLGDVLHVLLAKLFVLLAVTCVVVALRQAESALIDDRDLLCGVLEVLHGPVAEKDIHAVALQLAGKVGQANLGDVIDLSQELLQGSKTLPVDQRGICTGGVVVADLLLVWGAGGAGGV